MGEVRSGTVEVPGAQLYYEVRGSGTPLLLIQGGISEAGATDQLAAELAEDHEVISYDRRGLSRSTASDDVPVTMALHADDAARLLAALTDRPAHVVGASIGALIGLHLAVDHPARVTTVIAHEPPMSKVVHEDTREKELDTVAELATSDVRKAIRHMVSLAGERPKPEEGARPAPMVGDVDKNLTWFFANDFPAVRASDLDAGKLSAVPDLAAIKLTGGAEFSERWEYRCARQLARDLDLAFTEIPGGHEAPSSHPSGVAAAVRNLLP
ncbi:alpha/beta fold hydrolase [Amycolatopsis sp. CA-230715]|uniref:alpha/beta fold hydrolase n=1 Tax=Amycolatopsis sp. CA-230715 TaxID=2745196 RepID=UPI001C02A703|nr:alpha/beta hydrolase [Amycolatopsis sp. CA-230715]QWF80433.1 putative hydrolase [Amycolatopsis sp. CA-230715]